MGSYELAPGAEEDLWGIATYTIKNWGEEQTGRYEAALESHFDANTTMYSSWSGRMGIL